MEVRTRADPPGSDGCVAVADRNFTGGACRTNCTSRRGYGLHIWETLMDRGADLGHRAVRWWRPSASCGLEKGHLIVGQEHTDGP